MKTEICFVEKLTPKTRQAAGASTLTQKTVVLLWVIGTTTNQLLATAFSTAPKAV